MTPFHQDIGVAVHQDLPVNIAKLILEYVRITHVGKLIIELKSERIHF